VALPESHPIAKLFWNWIESDPDQPKYKAEDSSFALERDALPTLYPDLAAFPSLREFYQIEDQEFRSNYLAHRGCYSEGVYTLANVDHKPHAIQIWTDGSFSAEDTNGGTAAIIWTQGYAHDPIKIGSVEAQVFSSTQVQMIALQQAFEYVSKYAQGEEVQIYSDSLSALTYLNSRYWQISCSDTKTRLRTAFMQACQTATIQLIHVPGHAGIWQNVLADRYAKETLRDITVANVDNDIAQATEFAKSFYSRAPTYTKSPPPTTISAQTRTSLNRASAALSSFISKMILDCGYTMGHRAKFKGANLSDRCRICGSEKETPSHLWSCSDFLDPLDRSFDTFSVTADIPTSRSGWQPSSQQECTSNDILREILS